MVCTRLCHNKSLLMAKMSTPCSWCSWLNNHRAFVVQEVLPFCHRYDVKDAEAYLLERLGDIPAALEVITEYKSRDLLCYTSLPVFEKAHRILHSGDVCSRPVMCLVDIRQARGKQYMKAKLWLTELVLAQILEGWMWMIYGLSKTNAICALSLVVWEQLYQVAALALADICQPAGWSHATTDPGSNEGYCLRFPDRSVLLCKDFSGPIAWS